MGKVLKAFGGSIIARRDRGDISKLEHIKGKVVEAVSISGLGACQMQWRELQSRGLEFLVDPKEVRFAYNQKKIVKDGASQQTAQTHHAQYMYCCQCPWIDLRRLLDSVRSSIAK
jgi:hypothetical protein